MSLGQVLTIWWCLQNRSQVRQSYMPLLISLSRTSKWRPTLVEIKSSKSSWMDCLNQCYESQATTHIRGKRLRAETHCWQDHIFFKLIQSSFSNVAGQTAWPMASFVRISVRSSDIGTLASNLSGWTPNWRPRLYCLWSILRGMGQ